MKVLRASAPINPMSDFHSLMEEQQAYLMQLVHDKFPSKLSGHQEKTIISGSPDIYKEYDEHPHGEYMPHGTSALAQCTQKRRQDPETMAMLSNCDLAIDENEGESPNMAAKKTGKRMLNETFLNSLPKKVNIRHTSSLCTANCQAPLATATSTIINTNHSNVKKRRTS